MIVQEGMGYGVMEFTCMGKLHRFYLLGLSSSNGQLLPYIFITINALTLPSHFQNIHFLFCHQLKNLLRHLQNNPSFFANLPARVAIHDHISFNPPLIPMHGVNQSFLSILSRDTFSAVSRWIFSSEETRAAKTSRMPLLSRWNIMY